MRYLFYRDFSFDNLIDFFFPLIKRSSCIASCTYLALEFSEWNILINSTRTCMLLIDDLLGLFCLISGLITFKIAALQKSFFVDLIYMTLVNTCLDISLNKNQYFGPTTSFGFFIFIF